MSHQSQIAGPGPSEYVTFIFAGLCVLLAIVVAPLTGGTSWIGLVIAALLAWQGNRLRKERLAKTVNA